ncbi:hypothetical protein NDN08_003039 [Rhodosorus marinus]|uniref:Ribosomal RNA-processing protein 8 n=1 Tax=Rhodosorus marinus TaxID=101924 RepID=A0AAV8UVD4_9RHOD|nr:hypothetical protein NDN08_003039 [Rhodosorus marinus]
MAMELAATLGSVSDHYLCGRLEDRNAMKKKIKRKKKAGRGKEQPAPRHGDQSVEPRGDQVVSEKGIEKGRGSSDTTYGSRPRTLSKLQLAMRKRLESGSFRQINERLYSVTGKDAFKFMEDDPKQFSIYHSGYREQVKKWPRNPLDDIIRMVKKQPSYYVVADFGCGEARLATEVKQRVHSFDLVAVNENVTACNMRHTPLQSDSVDIAVFCLSLMGTDYPDFLTEARRILKPSGKLLIAEVLSRYTILVTKLVAQKFDKGEPGVLYLGLHHRADCPKFEDKSAFLKGVERMGFLKEHERLLSDFFVIWSFRVFGSGWKEKGKAGKNAMPSLKGSVYKKR